MTPDRPIVGDKFEASLSFSIVLRMSYTENFMFLQQQIKVQIVNTEFLFSNARLHVSILRDPLNYLNRKPRSKFNPLVEFLGHYDVVL